MTVQAWAPGDALSAPTVLCRSADVAALQAAILANGGTFAAFQVAPNGDDYIELLRCFLAMRDDANWVPNDASSVTADSAWIVRNLQRLANGLSIWDDNAALGAISTLLYYQGRLHPQQVGFLRFCEGLVSKVIRRLLWGSPMLHSWPPSGATRSWWQLNADLAMEIAGQLTDLKSTFLGSPPAAVQGLVIWLTQLQGRLNTCLTTTSREAAMVEASAFCAAISRMHFMRSRYALATVFCHRAADLLFTSLCATDGLIDFNQAFGDGALKNAVAGEKKLSLLNCHDAMVQAGTMLPDFARRAVLADLNLTRNRLLLTHGVGSPSQSDTTIGLNALLPILKAHGGADWTTAYTTYTTGVSLSAIALFELSDGLMQTLQPV